MTQKPQKTYQIVIYDAVRKLYLPIPRDSKTDALDGEKLIVIRKSDLEKLIEEGKIL